jgi:hypothetical protein
MVFMPQCGDRTYASPCGPSSYSRPPFQRFCHDCTSVKWVLPAINCFYGSPAALRALPPVITASQSRLLTDSSYSSHSVGFDPGFESAPRTPPLGARKNIHRPRYSRCNPQTATEGRVVVTTFQIASRSGKTLSHLWTDGLASWEVSFSLGTLVTSTINQTPSGMWRVVGPRGGRERYEEEHPGRR